MVFFAIIWNSTIQLKLQYGLKFPCYRSCIYDFRGATHALKLYIGRSIKTSLQGYTNLNLWRLHFRAANMDTSLQGCEHGDFTSGLQVCKTHFRAPSTWIDFKSSRLHNFMPMVHVVDFRPSWQKSRSFKKNQGRNFPGKGRKFPGKGRKKPVIIFDLFIFNKLQGS